MPKSSKKKKDKVADFSRAKLKLGKGKATPSNAIDTSFKARSIVLPTQSISLEKDRSGPLTKRQLSLTDLLSHLKHHNAGTRKDGISGLRELLDSHWDILEANLAQILNGVARLIGDEDASVRKQLLFFFSWLLPKIPSEYLIPHCPLLLLFTTSAQTHIFPEIRLDAVRIIDILMECAPDVVTEGWHDGNDGHGSRVLGGYFGILNAGTRFGEAGDSMRATSTSSVVLTPASKLVVLRSLSTFLRVSLFGSKRQEMSAGPSRLDAWFMRQAFTSAAAFQAFERFFATSASDPSSVQSWHSDTDDEHGDLFARPYPIIENTSIASWTLHDLADDPLSKAGGLGSSTTDFVMHLANTLHSTILDAYLDNAPTVFAPGSTPSHTEAQILINIIRIVRDLYTAIVQDTQTLNASLYGQLEDIINYMAPYFPAAYVKDATANQALEEFNLIFCELTALLLNASDNGTATGQQRSRKGKGRQSSLWSATVSLHVKRVTEYTLSRLQGEGGSSSGIATPITAPAYCSLLPTVWVLVRLGCDTERIMKVLIDHGIKTPSKSICKPLSIEFIGRLLLLDLEHWTVGSAEINASIRSKFEEWFLHLPQVLWELGGSNTACVEITLKNLLRTVQRQRHTPSSLGILTALQLRLVPYFHIDHPSRGPLPGPFTKLPSPHPQKAASSVRLLALDVVATIMGTGCGNAPRNAASTEAHAQAVAALSHAVGLAVVGGEAGYWTRVRRCH